MTVQSTPDNPDRKRNTQIGSLPNQRTLPMEMCFYGTDQRNPKQEKEEQHK